MTLRRNICWNIPFISRGRVANWVRSAHGLRATVLSSCRSVSDISIGCACALRSSGHTETIAQQLDRWRSWLAESSRALEDICGWSWRRTRGPDANRKATGDEKLDRHIPFGLWAAFNYGRPRGALRVREPNSVDLWIQNRWTKEALWIHQIWALWVFHCPHRSRSRAFRCRAWIAEPSHGRS